MRFLITGGLGYIGAHTALLLCEAGHSVQIIDDCRNSQEETNEMLQTLTKKEIQFFKLDITNTVCLQSLVIDKPDFIIHFAALKNVGESVQQPFAYYKNNLVGLFNILDLAKRLNCPNFIFSSSCTVYPHDAPRPLTEEIRAEASNKAYTTITTGHSPYGTSKLMAEQILHDLSKADDFWNIVILRYFNPVGNHPSGLIGDSLELKASMNLFTAILNNKKANKPTQIFGSDYPTRDGTAVRDYIHVLDLADAHICAAKWAEHKRSLEVFNIGTGQGYSVLEIVNKFIEKGFDVRYDIVGRRAGDIAEVFADSVKAKTVLGWEPKYTLDDMVLHSINYYNKH